MTMEITFPDDLQQFIEQEAQLKRSRPEDFVVSILRLAQKKQARERLEAKLLEGVESLNRGEGKPITPEFWERMREKIRERFGEEEQR